MMHDQPDTVGGARTDEAALDEIMASVDAMSLAEFQELCQDLEHTWTEVGTDS